MDGRAGAGTHGTAHRGLRRAATIGAALAGVPFMFVLAAGRASLVQATPIGGFYEVQARSLMNLRWNVPNNSIAFEAIVRDGKQYMYYGPWPSVLRMPVLAFTERLDGRLTQLSMLVAFAVVMAAVVSLVLQVRALVLRDAPVSRWERVAVGAFVFGVGAGSSVLFLASRAFVYHEAELWGLALALAAFAAVLRFVGTPTGHMAAIAAGLATLAFLSRASVGAGPVVALGLLLVASGTARTRAWVGFAPTDRTRALAVPLGVAFAVPVVLYAAVNWAKFGSLYALPLDRQLFTAMSASRRAALDANGGSLFGVRFLPTTLLQYLRPDAIRPWPLFPWLTFPPAATVVGDVRFDTIDLASSLPASMPLLCVLALVGIPRVVRGGRVSDGPGPARLRALVVGGLAGAAVTLTIGYVAQRYLSDLLPPVVLLATVGFFVVVDRLRGRSWRSRVPVVAVAGVCVLLLLVSVWTNFGLAVLYQRQLGGAGITTAELRGFTAFQYELARTVPGGGPPHVERGRRLPAPRERGTVFVVGDCAATYFSDGQAWRPLEAGAAGGGYPLRVWFPDAPDAPDAARQPLVVRGEEGSGQFVGVRYLPGHRVQLGYSSPETGGAWIDGAAIRVEPGVEHEVTVMFDSSRRRVVAEVDDTYALEVRGAVPDARPVTIGRTDIGGPVDATFTGRIERDSGDELCRELLDARG